MSDRSSPKGRWARRSHARPDEITAAALKLFAERGFAATKLEDVAQAAGISKGTIYLYFATKEDLFKAVVRQELLPTLERIEANVAAYDGPTPDLLRSVAARMKQIMETDAGSIPKLVLSESGNFPEIAQFYAKEVVGRGMRVFERILQRGAERGEFRAAQAQHVLPTFIGPVLLMLLWRHSIGRHTDMHFDHAAVLESHFDILLRGLAPDPVPELTP